MNAIHRVTGYGKRSERLEREHDIPPERLDEVYAAVDAPTSGEAALGSYPLDHKAATLVGLKLGTMLDSDAFDWFLEPFSDAGGMGTCSIIRNA